MEKGQWSRKEQSMSEELAGQQPAQRAVRIVKPHEFDANTPQTPGMQRVAGVLEDVSAA